MMPWSSSRHVRRKAAWSSIGPTFMRMWFFRSAWSSHARLSRHLKYGVLYINQRGIDGDGHVTQLRRHCARSKISSRYFRTQLRGAACGKERVVDEFSNVNVMWYHGFAVAKYITVVRRLRRRLRKKAASRNTFSVWGALRTVGASGATRSSEPSSVAMLHQLRRCVHTYSLTAPPLSLVCLKLNREQWGHGGRVDRLGHWRLIIREKYRPDIFGINEGGDLHNCAMTLTTTTTATAATESRKRMRTIIPHKCIIVDIKWSFNNRRREYRALSSAIRSRKRTWFVPAARRDLFRINIIVYCSNHYNCLNKWKNIFILILFYFLFYFIIKEHIVLFYFYYKGAPLIPCIKSTIKSTIVLRDISLPWIIHRDPSWHSDVIWRHSAGWVALVVVAQFNVLLEADRIWWRSCVLLCSRLVRRHQLRTWNEV